MAAPVADGPCWSPALPAVWQRRSMQQVKWCVPPFPPFPLCQEQLVWIVDIRSALKLPSNFSPERMANTDTVGSGCLLAGELWLHCITYLRAGCEVSLLILMLFVTQITFFPELLHLYFQTCKQYFQLILQVNLTSCHAGYFKVCYLDCSWWGLCLCTSRGKLEETCVCRDGVCSTYLCCTGVWHTHFWWVSGLGKVFRWWVATFLVWEWRFV